MRNLLLLALLTTLLPGCLLSQKTQNDPLRAEAIAQLVPGRTTAKDAVALLGAPTEVVQLGKRTAYRYDHARTKDAGLVLILVNLYNSDMRADRAWVFFDENDVLTHFAASLHADEASWAMPWQRVRSE